MKLGELSEEERKHLQSLVQGCQDVFDELNALTEKFSILGADSTSFKARSQKAWKKITWDQDEVTELRSRITSNVVMLEAFNGNLARLVSSPKLRSAYLSYLAGRKHRPV